MYQITICRYQFLERKSHCVPFRKNIYRHKSHTLMPGGGNYCHTKHILGKISDDSLLLRDSDSRWTIYHPTMSLETVIAGNCLSCLSCSFKTCPLFFHRLHILSAWLIIDQLWLLIRHQINRHQDTKSRHRHQDTKYRTLIAFSSWVHS